jgi:hypothetical protein
MTAMTETGIPIKEAAKRLTRTANTKRRMRLKPQTANMVFFDGFSSPCC